MKKKSVGVGVVASIVAMFILFLKVERGEAAIDCGQLDTSLLPCLPYLVIGGNPSEGCCRAVKGIKEMAPDVEQRRGVCECLKKAASRYPSLRQDVVAHLPQLCNVDISVPIIKDIDCTKIT